MRVLQPQLGQFQPSGLPPALSKQEGKNTLQTEADALDLVRGVGIFPGSVTTRPSPGAARVGGSR